MGAKLIGGRGFRWEKVRRWTSDERGSGIKKDEREDEGLIVVFLCFLNLKANIDFGSKVKYLLDFRFLK